MTDPVASLGLVPIAAFMARRFLELAAEAGVPVKITEGWRAPARQIELYKLGRAAPVPMSPLWAWKVVDRSKVVTWALPEKAPHCRAAAFDFVPLVDGKPAWERLDLFAQLGAIGERVGFEWGGRWTFKDLPHLQLANWASLPLVKERP